MEKSIDGNLLKFSCGCQFNILPDGNLDVCFDPHNPNHTIKWDCPETFKTITEHAQGIFQLESPLGKAYVKKLKPENLEHLGALGAILRPGSMESLDSEGISTTKHYVKRKNLEEAVADYHPIIDKILAPTFGEMIYQEQMLQIARECAGFTLQEADVLRKACGKKLPEEMAKVKKLFMEKVKSFGVLNEKQGEEVWDKIEKSQRYSFNKCLSGDTLITVASGERKQTIRDLYNLIHYKVNKYADPPFRRIRARYKQEGTIALGLSMMEDGTLIKNRVIGIDYSGHLPVYRLTTEDGCYVDLTLNHKVLTNNGTKLVSDLGSEDRLYSKLRHKLDTALLKVKALELIGIQDTYDVEMDEPYHNLCVNKGLIVCNSHAISYGNLGYECGYVKTHFPLWFYVSWLRKEDKVEVYKDIVEDAKSFAGINIYTPDLSDLQEEFYTKNGNIYFGLLNIKGVQEADIKYLTSYAPSPSWKKMDWIGLLVGIIDKLNFSTAKALIRAGALDYLKIDRQKMLNDLLRWRDLNKDEQALINLNGEKDTIESLYEQVLSKKKFRGNSRKSKLQEILKGIKNPPAPLIDTVDSIIYAEENLLGLAINSHVADNIKSCIETHTCKDIIDGYNKYAVLKVKVDRSREWEARNGAMAFLTISDHSGILDKCAAFSDVYQQYKTLLCEGNLVFVAGKFNKDKQSFNVQRVYSV